MFSIEEFVTTTPFGDITEKKYTYDGAHFSSTFTINTSSHDKISINIRYNKEQQPDDASIYPLDDPADPEDVPSDGGASSVILLRALIRYIHQLFPSITHVQFEDQSVVYPEDPLPLRYFWIAFGGETWFETHFHAIYQSEEAHDKYRQRVDTFLATPTPPFHDFLRHLLPIIPHSDRLWENKPLFQEVEQLYAKATTYKELFDSIPKERRCEHARIWVIYLVEGHVKYVMDRMGWRIDVTSLPESQPDDSSLQIQRDGGRDMWRAQYIAVSDLDDD